MWSSSDGFVWKCICVCVCACVKEYWAFSSQMSAEQSLCTITSGHLGPINTVSELQLCLFFFVPYCLFIIVSLLSLFLPLPLSLSVLLFPLSHCCFSLSLSFSPPPACIHVFVYSSLSSCTAPMREHMHFTVFLPLLPPPASVHTYTLSLFSLSQLVATLLSLFLPCLHLLVLLSLVIPFDSSQNINSSLDHRQQQNPFAIQIVFSQDCHLVYACVVSAQHKSSCKWLYTWWASYLEKYVKLVISYLCYSAKLRQLLPGCCTYTSHCLTINR